MNFKEEQKEKVEKIEAILRAVSYTHLDVYKRQFLYFVSCCDRNLSGSISIDEFICRRKNRRACPIDAGVLPKFLSGGCIYRKEQFGVDVL